MNNIIIIPEHFSPKRPVEDDEYFNVLDGKIYCKNCNTPRQGRYVVEGLNRMVLTPDIKCKCQNEAEEKEKKEQEHIEHMYHVNQLKERGLRDARLYDYNFSNDNGINPEIRYAKAYVENWTEMESRGDGLLFWGAVGTGKTFIAGCIANALIEQGIPVMMTNLSEIINELAALPLHKRQGAIDGLKRQYRLLIIDDLGIERNSDFAQEQIFNVVDSWYRSNQPMIVTTNMELEELKHPKNMSQFRIYDRILEKCIPIRINKKDIRTDIAASNLKDFKERFSEYKGDNFEKNREV